MQSVTRSSMLVISLRQYSGGILYHACLTRMSSWLRLLGFGLRSTDFFTLAQRFSMGLRSELWGGQSIVRIPSSLMNCIAILVVCGLALSCWKNRQQSLRPWKFFRVSKTNLWRMSTCEAPVVVESNGIRSPTLYQEKQPQYMRSRLCLTVLFMHSISHFRVIRAKLDRKNLEKDER